MNANVIQGRFYNVPEEKWLSDGIYVFSEEDDIEFLYIDSSLTKCKQREDVDSFMEKFPDWVLASAYETFSSILLSKKPPKYTGLVFGNGFNYGSTNILAGLPASINYVLILAQND